MVDNIKYFRLEANETDITTRLLKVKQLQKNNCLG